MRETRGHILVVDDLPDNRSLLVQLLQHQGFRTSEAVDGQEALARIAEERPDLVLLDLMMPVMDGYEVLERLKAEPEYLPVIVITALTERDERLRALALGADEFLNKPIDPEELAHRVRWLLKLQQAHRDLQTQQTQLQVLNEELHRHNEMVESEVAARTSEVRRREREFRTLAEHMPDLIVRFDRELRYMYLNPAAARAFGASEEAWLGKRLGQTGLPAVTTEALTQALEAAFRTGEAAEREFVLPDGPRYYSAHLVPESDEQGRIERVLMVSRDITERKVAEEQRRLFEVLVDSVVDYAILMLDTEGHITSWNKGAERVKGYTPEEAIGRPHSMFYTVDDRGAGKPRYILQEAARLGHFEDEGWRVRKDGSRFWASVVVTALRDESGRLLGFAKITRDLTERRQAEQKLAAHAEELQEANERLGAQTEELQSQAEELQAQSEEMLSQHESLQASNIQLQQLTAQLQQLDALKDNFLSILSHELRTPLNAILGFASILDDEVVGPMTPQQHQYLGKILNGGELLLALINDLLDMSRIQAGSFALIPGRMDPGELCREVVDSLHVLAERKQQELECILERDLPAMVADRQRVGQVLINLVSNAIKFSPDGGRIQIHMARKGECLRVDVVDNGPGIRPDDVPRLFQRFTQLETGNTRSASGTGLGLSISKALVEAHGGHIGVETTPGLGSTFWFTIPLAPAGARAECSEPQ